MVQIQWEMWERFCISIVQHTQTHIFGVSVCFSRERCRWWYCCYHCEFVRVAHPRLLFSMFIFRFFFSIIFIHFNMLEFRQSFLLWLLSIVFTVRAAIVVVIWMKYSSTCSIVCRNNNQINTPTDTFSVIIHHKNY